MDTDLSFEERNKAVKICRENLSGVWVGVNLSAVRVSKISGGLTNILYHCALADIIDVHGNEPRELVIRLYGSPDCDIKAQLEIFTKLAEQNLGPKLYATFDGGRIEEYLPSNPLSWQQMVDEQVSAVVARKMAAIHKLNMESLDTNSEWLVDICNTYASSISKTKRSISTSKLSLNLRDSTRVIVEQLMSLDFKTEIEFVDKLIKKCQCPKVFSHNDLVQNNVLILDKTKEQLGLDDRIVLIDFEYASYNYLPFDAADHLCEWCYDYNSEKQYPHFKFSSDNFPSETRQRDFLSNYIEALGDHWSLLFDKLHLNKSNNYNSVDRKLPPQGDSSLEDKIDFLYNEMQPFLMASNLLWCLWGIKSACSSSIEFGYWEYSYYKWQLYCFCKESYERRTKGMKL